MATEPSESNTASTDANGNELKQCETFDKSKLKSRSRKGFKASPQKVLTRREKLESVKKANQALLKALKLMSQRNGSTTDAKGDI